MNERSVGKAWSVLVLSGVFLLAAASSGWAGGSPTTSTEVAPPRVIETSPVRGEELAVDGTVALVFDRPMDRASVESAVNIVPAVAGQWQWTSDTTIRFAPAELWTRDVAYTVSVGATARDATGIPLAEPFSLRLRTVGFLTVTQMIPVDGATEIAADSTITVMFNRPVVALASVSAPGTEPQPAPLVIEPAVAGAGQWLNTSVYVFTPTAPLLGGTVYRVTVRAGLTDTTGGLLGSDVSWSFTTERPSVVWTSPRDGDELVSLTEPVRVTFNMPMDVRSAQSRLSVREVTLFGLWSTPVEGSLAAEGNDLVFKPAAPLAFDRQYVVTLEPGVTAHAGGLGTSDFVRFRFHTVPVLRILGTSPSDGEANMSPYGPFVIEFTAPVNEDTVLKHITIDPAPKPEDISGYFSSWDLRYVVYFAPQPSRTYTVTISPGIEDPYGNKTEQALTVRFSTAPLDPAAWLQVPGNVGTYSSYEPAHIVVAHQNTSRLTLTLAKIDVAQYFEAVQSWYDYTPPARSRVRTWSVDVTSPLNEFAYTPVDLLDGGGPLDPGIYVIDLQANGVEWNRWQGRHLLISTPTHLVMKTSETETLVWATDLETGAPVSGLILSGMDADGTKIDVDVSDSHGVARFPGSAALDWRGLTIMAQSPFSLASSDWNSGITPWEFGFTSETPPSGRAYLDSDRPIYRAGQMVFFRAVLRDEADAHYDLPAAREAHVRIMDPNWSLVYEQTLALDAFGAVAGELALAADAALGDYTLSVEYSDRSESTSFQVAAYRAPEFDVVVTPEHDEIVKADPTRAVAQVSYFFGAPVADAAVEWNVLSEPYAFTPSAFGQYSFSDIDDPWICFDCWWQTPATPTPVLQGDGKTDASGALVIDLPADVASRDPQAADGIAKGSRLLTVEATAHGPDGTAISGRTTIIAHPASFYAGLAADQSIGQAGRAMSLRAVTVDWTGERIGSRDVRYTVFRREWKNTWEPDASGGGSWKWTTDDTEVARGTLTTDERGDGAFSFTPPTGGSYKVVVEGLDELERTARSSLFVWVSGPDTVSWRQTNDDRVTLISDKTSYKVGETAQILIPSPYPGEQWALVTIERGGVLSERVVLLPSNSTVLPVEITGDDVPNIYVSVVLVQGRAAATAAGGLPTASMKVGYAALSVDPAPQLLSVALAGPEGSLLPGQTASYTLTVTDSDGAPVQGQFSLDVVDKAILTLRPREADRIATTFYGPRGLGVMTSSSLTLSLSRLVLEQLQQNVGGSDTAKAGAEGPGLMAGAPAPMMAMSERSASADQGSAAAQLPAGVALRENFVDAAYWNAAVTTDADGRTALDVKLPDNLTTWVVRAVGVTTDTKVGEATIETLVTKPLLIRPVTPRFFVVGDRVRLAASVTNQTSGDLDVEMTLASTGLSLEGPAVQTLAVPAGSERQATWWVTVGNIESVDLAFSAVAGGLSDAARPRLTTGPEGTIPVYRYNAPETIGTAGDLRQAGGRTETIALPANYDAKASRLDVRLDVSLAAAMREGLGYLEHFEYECTEQVVSRFLPNVLTYRALRLLGIEDADLAARLHDLVLEGLEKLYVRQNSDGGWGWWDGESSSPYLTAYAMYALLRLQESDTLVRSDVVDRAGRYLETTLVSEQDLGTYREANRQAWVLYVLSLAGRSDPAASYTSQLFAHRAKLSHYGKAYLAMALDRLGAPRTEIDTLLSDLVNASIQSATGMHWEEADYDWWAMNTDTRSTGIILDAFVELDPKNALLPNVVRWLMVARKGGIWETTQETAWSLVALTDWMVATGELDANYTYGLLWDGAEKLAATATRETVQDSATASLSGDELATAGRHALTVFREDGPGVLYYTAQLSLQLPADEVGALNRGIVVSRQYVPSNCALDASCPDVSQAVVGETYEVRLTIVAPNDLYYVALEDPLPAGCEAVDTSLATTSVLETGPSVARESSSGTSVRFPWWWWRWYSRSELRDEKVVLFAEYLPAGTYSYRYTVRAVQPGEFKVLPAVAREFYFPEVFGRSDGRAFTVVPAGE